MHRSRMLSLLSFVCLPALAAPVMAAMNLVAPITNDTYVDSYYNAADPSLTNQRTNFGSSAAIKAVSDDGSGDKYPGTTSVCHTLFTLPSSFWSAYDAGTLTSASIQIPVRNNSLQTNQSAYPTGYRSLQMYPLTQAFVAGTGGVNTATNGGSVNNSPAGTYYGADWMTTDGQTPWTTLGGSADTSVGVTSDAITAATTAVNFDLSAFLASPTAMAEIRANGLFIRVQDETNFTGNVFASMVSYDSSQSTTVSTNKGSGPNTFYGMPPTVTFTPEPASLGLIGGTIAVMLCRNRKLDETDRDTLQK